MPLIFILLHFASSNVISFWKKRFSNKRDMEKKNCNSFFLHQLRDKLLNWHLTSLCHFTLHKKITLKSKRMPTFSDVRIILLRLSLYNTTFFFFSTNIFILNFYCYIILLRMQPLMKRRYDFNKGMRFCTRTKRVWDIKPDYDVFSFDFFTAKNWK